VKLVLLLFVTSGVWAQNNPAPAKPAPPPGAPPPTAPAQTTAAPPPTVGAPPSPANAPPPPAAAASDDNIPQLALRMTQLMESTAVPVPGLIQASQPIKQRADTALAAMKKEPANPLPVLDFMNQIKAYLALADSIPRPEAFPPTADRQYAELREAVDRMQRQFTALLKTQIVEAQKREADPNQLNRYADANAKLLPSGKIPVVVFLGDSSFDSWRLNEYFTGRDFLNRAIAGQTSSQMLARFIPDVIALNPKLVVILAGTNDIAGGVAVNQIEDNLTAMGDLAKAHGIKVIFASLLPVSDYHKNTDPRYEMTKSRPPATIQAVNRWLQMFCSSQGFIYMDYYSVLVDPASQMKTDLSDDGLNPNSKGYRVMSPVTLMAIDGVLNRAQPPAPAAPKKRGLFGN
jgi:lysophospholipase L1-like esterase